MGHMKKICIRKYNDIKNCTNYQKAVYNGISWIKGENIMPVCKCKRKVLLIFMLTMSIFLISCGSADNYQAEIAEVVKTKIEGVKEKDAEKYLGTVDKGNSSYYREQMRWIQDIQANNIENYNLEIVKMELVDENNAVVTLKQTYKYKYKNYEVQYDARYVKTEDGWKDSDVNFSTKETEHFIVKYMEGDQNLDKVINEAEKAIDIISGRYGRSPKEKILIKVYKDRELLRQCTKLSIEWQFTGWFEIGEGLKVFSGRETEYNYESLFAHELTHKLTMEDSNNNMPYWFAEGLAMYYANFPDRGGNPIELGRYDVKDFNISIERLEKMNLEVMTANYDIGRYYGVSGMIIEYIAENYGEEKVVEVIEKLGEYPFNDNLDSESYDKENQQKLREVIQDVMGKSLDEISVEWLAWLNNLN